MYVDNTLGQRYIVRYEKNGTNQTTVLANRIDSLIFRYYDEKVTYTTTTNSDGEADITSVCVTPPAPHKAVSAGSAKFIVIAWRHAARSRRFRRQWLPAPNSNHTHFRCSSAQLDRLLKGAGPVNEPQPPINRKRPLLE